MIHITVYALVNPLRLIPTPGQVHDSTQAEAFVDGFVSGPRHRQPRSSASWESPSSPRR
jgi:hypothetical protein